MAAADLGTFTLEDAGTRTLTTCGIRFRKRDYVGPWMTGQAGIQARIRFMPTTTTASRSTTPPPAATSVPRTWPTRPPRNRSALHGGHGGSHRERYAAVNQPEAPSGSAP
ncbi:Mu transposase C-terminal domain-containing protein [Streptomyces albus]|uniref:Mu transposase C-terminal domain-containing protein n=1 Tax=Streptomyces albus TaxID=1888 RepID=UPI00345441B1